jgi:dihydroorotase, multifunctional complex type
MNSFILKNARLGTREMTILVIGGKIAHVYPYNEASLYPAAIPEGLPVEIPGQDELAKLPVVDGQGLKVMPSLIDVHVHLREPGQEWKETIATGLRAAAHGGFGSVMCMANTVPTNDNSSVTRLMLEQARMHFPHGPRLYPVGALTKGLEGKELAPMAELAAAGCVAFSNDGKPVTNTELFRRAMEYANDQDCIVLDHCEDEFLAAKTHMNESELSGRMGLKGMPAVAETIQVYRDIMLSEYLKIPIHIQHVSHRRSVEAITAAKQRNVPVTCETCPHYLFLSEETVKGYDTSAKVNPPLREQGDVEALRAALSSGAIDMLATDHAPHSNQEKEVEFDMAPFGISGLDSALSLTWELVRQGVITEIELLSLWCYNPSRIFGIPANTFRAGDPADFFLFDPEERWKLTPETMHSKGKNSPFIGRQMVGKVKSHWISGHQVV